MDKAAEVLSLIATHLTNSQIVVAAGGDPQCVGFEAYVWGQQPPIVLCPPFFHLTPEHQVRRLIHEAAHLAQIGEADLAESYCQLFDCKSTCGGLNSADAWAHFIHCVSGKTPDQPKKVRVRRPSRQRPIPVHGETP